MDNFAQALDTGGDTILNAEDGRHITAVVQACLESSKSGEMVHVS